MTVDPRHRRGPRKALYTRRLEQTERLFERLRDKSARGIPIIVEGREDERALRELQVTGKIYCLKAHGETRFAFLDKLDGQTDEVILLTDFDREGGELRLWLYDELVRRRIRVDDRLWNRIRAVAHTEVHAVEELPSFLRTIQTRALGL